MHIKGVEKFWEKLPSYTGKGLVKIRCVEEKELIQRFCTKFLEYRPEVSELLVKPQKIKTYFRFLVGRD